MKKNYFSISTIVLLHVLFATPIVYAQVVQKIGTNPFIINSKTVLELESTTKGFLPPRLTVTQQTDLGITLPQGLLIYVIDGAHEGIQLWDGTKWVYYVDSASLALKSTIASPTFTGTVGGINAAMVGLGNVNNTSDVLKPVSIATQSALNLKEDKINKINDINSDPNSDIKYPSVSAVKNYVDSYNPVHAITTIDSDYTAERSDYTILCTTLGGAFELKLPDAREALGKIYVIRKIDESLNSLSISPTLKLTENTLITALNYPKTIRIQSNGTDWYIID